MLEQPMTLPVTIENDALKMEVWPAIGGKIASLVDKADKFELLFAYPAELPQTAQYDIPYINSWYQGWDECFPTVGPSTYSGHPYDGIAAPDHGELWGIPTTAVPTENGITTVWHGLRFGYRLTRKLTLDGPSLIADYTLVNLSPFEFQFIWAAHALMSTLEPMELVLPGNPAMLTEGDTERFAWPTIGDGSNLSQISTLGEHRSWKVYSVDPIVEPAVVRYPRRGRQVKIAYTSDEVSAFWGIWINTGEWARQRHIAVEPTTGRFGGLAESMKDHSTGCVPGSGQVRWQVRWTVEAM